MDPGWLPVAEKCSTSTAPGELRPEAASLLVLPGTIHIFQMDWKRARRPITKYTLPFLQSVLHLEKFASALKPVKCVGNTTQPQEYSR